MQQILETIFINIMILVSFTFIIGQIFENFLLKNSGSTSLTLRTKCLVCFLEALSAIALLHFRFSISKFEIDLRMVPIIQLAMYMGTGPAVVTSILVMIAEIIFYGRNTWTIWVFFGMAMVAIGSGIISDLKLTFSKKCLYIFIYVLLIVNIVTFMALKNMKLFIMVSRYYSITMIISCLFMYIEMIYINKLRDIHKQLKENSIKDYLTGLYNVRFFALMLQDYNKNFKDQKEIFSIIFIDTDHFKDINDNYGHPAGDYIIKQLGMILSANCRKDDVVFRFGGDEFAILLPGCSHDSAVEIAERIRRAVEMHEFILPDGTSIKTTVSIGVATSTDKDMDVGKIINCADAALYKAKSSGKNKVCSI
ncbi:GGDEF domain-containing protein [Fonticella tunisiensis]|uniref:Diguanylate cyclase n=1 Tax=Fonticella tunisiensis TaxID=1096341 RepID=A0A4R7K5J6_9CLOT|nr:GGDEF domain-containing protein [Fonticella tunisiensis]TDT46059.1 diguanylate cyclase [Fonticella tunisiensis]